MIPDCPLGQKMTRGTQFIGRWKLNRAMNCAPTWILGANKQFWIIGLNPRVGAQFIARSASHRTPPKGYQNHPLLNCVPTGGLSCNGLSGIHTTLSPLRARKQHGFVLMLTLWVLVIVALAAGYFAESVTRSIELAQQSRLNTRAMIDMAGTRAEILYRLGTTSVTEQGLGRGSAAINLDNRTYRGLGDTLLNVQDSRGLLNLNIPDDDRLQRLLGLLGIPASQRGHLNDTLRDFTDADNLHRLNGAEKEEYLALNLPPPINRNLITPWEARRIIGWRDAPQLWQSGRLVELTTTGASIGLNPNTAPAGVLATLPGVTEEIAQAIIARRKFSPIMNAGQLAEIIGIPAQILEDFIAVLPSNSIRITQSTKGLPWAIQYNIMLTPNGNEGPWRTDYYSRVNTAQRNETQTQIPELPPRSTAPFENVPLF